MTARLRHEMAQLAIATDVEAKQLPLDWLKTRGYIVDDKRKHVRCEVPEQIIQRGLYYRVRITLTPATPLAEASPETR